MAGTTVRAMLTPFDELRLHLTTWRKSKIWDQQEDLRGCQCWPRSLLVSFECPDQQGIHRGSACHGYVLVVVEVDDDVAWLLSWSPAPVQNIASYTSSVPAGWITTAFSLIGTITCQTELCKAMPAKEPNACMGCRCLLALDMCMHTMRAIWQKHEHWWLWLCTTAFNINAPSCALSDQIKHQPNQAEHTELLKVACRSTAEFYFHITPKQGSIPMTGVCWL